MIFKRVLRRAVFSETFSTLVIIVIHSWSCPVVTFNPKMIIPPACQRAAAIPRFQNSLRQFNAGRNAGPVHLAHRNWRKLTDVILSCVILPGRLIACCFAGNGTNKAIKKGRLLFMEQIFIFMSILIAANIIQAPAFITATCKLCEIA
jgi:hypothetical protein